MELERVYFKSASGWRMWLSANHAVSKGVWLIYFKKHTGQKRVPYSEAVEEALCFGWIDSIVKRIDDQKFMQKFTPRNPKSNWSDINKKRVEKMIRENKMTPAGINAVKLAKKFGKWDSPSSKLNAPELSADLFSMIKNNRLAFSNYSKLTEAQKKYYSKWVMVAKKEETRIKRCREMILLLEKNKKLGLK